MSLHHDQHICLASQQEAELVRLHNFGASVSSWLESNLATSCAFREYSEIASALLVQEAKDNGWFCLRTLVITIFPLMEPFTVISTSSCHQVIKTQKKNQVCVIVVCCRARLTQKIHQGCVTWKETLVLTMLLQRWSRLHVAPSLERPRKLCSGK